MLHDQRASRWLNGLCATAALGTVCGIGWLSYRAQQAERPLDPPKATARLREILQMGRKAARSGDTASARRYFEDAVRFNPRHETARYEYAKFLLDGRDMKGAWAQLSSYVPAAMGKHRPVCGDDSVLAWYGDLAARYGDAKLGDAACRAVIKKNCDGEMQRAQGVRLRALAHCAAGGGLMFGPPRPDRIAHDRRAIELDPKFALAYLSLANALVETKQVPESRKPLEAALCLIEPNQTLLKVIAAHLLFDVGDTSRSVALLRRSARQAPVSDTGLASMIGFDLMRAGETDEALAEVRRALPMADPKKTKVYVQLALLLGQLGKKDDAVAMVHRAEKLASAEDRDHVQQALTIIQRGGPLPG